MIRALVLCRHGLLCFLSAFQKGDAGGSPAAGGDGNPEPNHSLLKNFFRGLMNRTGERGGAGGSGNAKDKKVKAKARDELKKMNGSSSKK